MPRTQRSMGWLGVMATLLLVGCVAAPAATTSPPPSPSPSEPPSAPPTTTALPTATIGSTPTSTHVYHSIDELELSSDLRHVTILFGGAMEYVPGEKCSADYAADITVVGETLEVGVYVARTGTVPSPTADIAVDCDSIGVPRVLEVDLENPFQGSAWRDLAGTVHPFETPAPTLPEPPTASPTALSFDEDDLIADYSRRLAGPHCDRRRPLPANVLLGIECADEVDRWVIHVYATEEPARDAYVRRLGLDNVALETGDCVANVPGDTAWAGPPHSADAPWRAGCFVDEEGLLNGRVTCPHLTDPEEWLYDAAMYIGYTTSNPNFDGNLQLAYDSLWLGTGNRELALTEPYLGVVPPRICYEYFPGFPYDEDIEPAP